MKAKTLSEKNGNGHHSEMGTIAEGPSMGAENLIKSAFTVQAADTELEEVEGFTLLNQAEADKEVTNEAAVEAAETTDTFEESGIEVPALDALPKEAFFASYSELLPKMESISEVIIGTDDRVRINTTTIYPWRAVCALRITARDGSRWIGTGWLVSPRTVITAGHCVFLHDHGGWARSIEVIPGINDASRPYGSCSSNNLRSVQGWTQNKNRDFDYGAIILPANCRLGDRTGYFGYAVRNDAYLLSSTVNLSGYPGDKRGNQKWYMARRPKSVSSRVIYYDIDTMGGQSGAPVWIKIGTARYCVGIHTNGASSGNSATRIAVPVFNNIMAWKALGM
jgi:V8-like Glu-specific endopeptidase